MEVDSIKFSEHLAIDCSLSIQKFCSVIQKRLVLPDFEFDSENETEWGLVEHKGIEYNISRPYKRGALQKWDKTVPQNCNFGISLSILNDCPPKHNPNWSSVELVPQIGQIIADLFNTEVYHHRTWLGVGDSLARNRIFYPKRVSS